MALMVLVLVLASTVAYLLIGWKTAMRMLPWFWAAARREWSPCEDLARGSVKARAICMVLFWIVLLPIAPISRGLSAAVDASDPKALEKRIRDRDRRIAELEHELKIQP